MVSGFARFSCMLHDSFPIFSAMGTKILVHVFDLVPYLFFVILKIGAMRLSSHLDKCQCMGMGGMWGTTWIGLGEKLLHQIALACDMRAKQ